MNNSNIILKNQIILNAMKNNISLSPNEKKKLLLSKSSSDLEKIWNDKIRSSINEEDLCLETINFDLHSLLSSVPDYVFSKSNRKDYIDAVGDNVISDNLKSIILNGSNYRLITEDQVKSKLVLANQEVTKMIDRIPSDYLNRKNIKYFFLLLGMEIIINTKSSKEYILSLWLLGLTSKGLDNIVGNSYSELYEYCMNHYISSTKIVEEANERGNLSFRDFVKFLCIDFQALTIKGSMKSMAGKLFERLILGTSLSILGFEFKSTAIPTEDYDKYADHSNPIFWLSSKEDNDGREKDATILFKKKIINIDIGLIGKGNPEIINDKITRYRDTVKRNHIDIASEHTIVIAGEKNDGQTITQAAREAHATVIEIHDNKNWIVDLNDDITNFFDNFISKFNYNDYKDKNDVIDIDFKKFIQ
ncbi:hypothetical protein AKUH3B209X_01100 [Apilactobacillus kunkeei]|nr:hypothetical protein AKUH3B209X_01100 [Apilactobacillus kunkeei]CAI2555475.1 hypothetical protein AKUA1401_01160 [Apilactobacillus kunkeei]